MGRLTKADIVTRALEIVGNTDIQARGELWCDLLLDATARNYRWPELQKQHSATLAAGGQYVTYPSDYGTLVYSSDIRGVGVWEDSDGNRSPLLEIGLPGLRSNLVHTTDNTGTPTYVADDKDNSRWVFHPIAEEAGTVRLEYTKVPALIASTDTPWYPNDLALMNAVADIGEQYMRGTLVSVKNAVKEQSSRLALAAPSRAKLFTGGGPGDGLDPRFFRPGT